MQIFNLIISITGFLAMYDVVNAAFRTAPNPNVIIQIGRFLLEIISGCAGFGVCFCFLLIFEGFMDAAYKELTKRLKNDDGN